MRAALSEWLSIILKVMFIGILVLAIPYFALTVWGNLSTMHSGTQTSAPTLQQAKYGFIIQNTGQVVLSNDYEQTGDIYRLHGYYDMVNNKWHYHKYDLVIDEYYFGPVTEVTRTSG